MTDTSTKDEGTELESDRPGDALRPGKPTMLSHVAYVTRDTAATVDRRSGALLPFVLPDGRRLDRGLLRGA